MLMRINQPDAGTDADMGTSGVDSRAEIKPHGYVRLNLMHWRKDSFLTNEAGNFGCPCVEDRISSLTRNKTQLRTHSSVKLNFRELMGKTSTQT